MGLSGFKIPYGLSDGRVAGIAYGAIGYIDMLGYAYRTSIWYTLVSIAGALLPTSQYPNPPNVY